MQETFKLQGRLIQKLNAAAHRGMAASVEEGSGVSAAGRPVISCSAYAMTSALLAGSSSTTLYTAQSLSDLVRAQRNLVSWAVLEGIRLGLVTARSDLEMRRQTWAGAFHAGH
jgi:hypothetical protein